MAIDPTKASESKEVTDAQDAKDEADPAVNDPSFMPNIEPQKGKGKSGKAKAKPKKGAALKPKEAKKAEAAADLVDDELPATPKGKKGAIRLDPNLKLIPGNAVTFVAEEGDGVVTAKIETGGFSYMVKASNGGGDARVSKIIERPGDITVTFYDDGKAYASDTWPIG